MTATIHPLRVEIWRTLVADLLAVKPRIRWSESLRMFCCFGRGTYGAGLTPVRAYENWRAKHLGELREPFAGEVMSAMLSDMQ